MLRTVTDWCEAGCTPWCDDQYGATTLPDPSKFRVAYSVVPDSYALHNVKFLPWYRFGAVRELAL